MGGTFQRVGDAQMKRPDIVTSPANEMVMVRFATVEFVARRAVAKITASHQLQFLESGQGSIDCHEVATSPRHPLMNLVRGERPMFARQNLEDRAPGTGDALPLLPKQTQRGGQRIV